MSTAVPIKAAEGNLEDLLTKLSLGEAITLIGSEGKPVGLLVSLESKAVSASPGSDWDERMDVLAQEVSKAWKSDRTAVEILSEMRR